MDHTEFGGTLIRLTFESTINHTVVDAPARSIAKTRAPMALPLGRVFDKPVIDVQ